jgi:hypothetical protein
VFGEHPGMNRSSILHPWTAKSPSVRTRGQSAALPRSVP